MHEESNGIIFSDMNGSLPIYRADFRDLNADAEFPVAAPKPDSLRNGMLVRMPNHLGDAVMALPALLALKRSLPEECGLYVITPGSLRQLYAVLDCVNGIFSFGRTHSWWGWKQLRRLRALRMGACVLFNNSLRDVISLRLARIPQLYGAARRGRSILLTRSFDFPRRFPRRLAEAHLAKRYMAMARALGGRAETLEMPRFDLSRLLVSPTGLLCALARHPLHLVLAAGAAYGAAKRWPERNFNIVAKYWLRHGGVVSVVGSAAEREVGELVLSDLPTGRCFNLCGETTLNHLIVLLKGAALCVANDSGVMHLAAALGAPGVAVFGPTDPAATAPISDKWLLLYKQLPCAPCFRRECPDNRCIQAITPAMVLRAMRRQCRDFNVRLEKRRRF